MGEGGQGRGKMSHRFIFYPPIIPITPLIPVSSLGFIPRDAGSLVF